jgi:hypothetical protein
MACSPTLIGACSSLSRKREKQQHINNMKFRCVVVSLLTKSINKFSASQEIISKQLTNPKYVRLIGSGMSQIS